MVPQDTLAISFAMIAGESLVELLNGASAAQAMYDSLFGEPEDTTSIASFNATLQVDLYPNPSQGLVTLFYSDAPGNPTTLEIIDLAGHIVYVSELDPHSIQSTHDISALAAGVYHYRLQSAGFQHLGKLVLIQ
jgi:hypothetical protein